MKKDREIAADEIEKGETRTRGGGAARTTSRGKTQGEEGEYPVPDRHVALDANSKKSRKKNNYLPIFQSELRCRLNGAFRDADTGRETRSQDPVTS